MYERIVVGTDGSGSAGQAVKEAARLAKQCGAVLHVVTAFKPLSALMTHPEFATFSASAYESLDPAGGAKATTEHAAVLIEKGVDVEQHQVPGSAVDALCDVAQTVGADLIVVGNRGMTGARRVLGSVPNSVAHNAPCSVLIVQTT